MKRESERGQGVMEFVGGLFLLGVMALIILIVLGPQIKQVHDQIMQSMSFNQFDPVDEAYLAERAALDMEEAAYQDSLGYSDLPFTQHAIESHAGETWNASSIAQWYDNGRCMPKRYSCDQDDFEVHYCELNPGKSIALVIGKTIKMIITGFMADTPYWTNRCGTSP